MRSSSASSSFFRVRFLQILRLRLRRSSTSSPSSRKASLQGVPTGSSSYRRSLMMMSASSSLRRIGWGTQRSLLDSFSCGLGFRVAML